LETRLTRRALLRVGAASGVGLSLSAILAACGPAAPSSSTPAAPSGGGNAGGGSSSAPPPPPKTWDVQIPKADRFDPWFLQINVGDTIKWTNGDTDSHAAVSIPGAPDQFTGVIAPNQSFSFTFKKAGVYSYYCNVHADFDDKTKRVKCHQDASEFPAAMEGLVVVLGPDLQSQASDSASVQIPKEDRFDPYWVVVKKGGKVTWTNNDTDAHAVIATPDAPEQFQQPNLPGNGGKFDHTFNKPGIYPYYCNIHVDYDSNTKLFKAHKDASAFPIAMAGFVIVV
jgi:plastocyanin